MMRYRITHRTRYTYEAEVSHCYNIAHLLPRDTKQQECISSFVKTEPGAQVTNRRRDYFGNNVFYFSLQDPHDALEVTSVSEVLIREVPESLDLDFGITCAQALTRLRDGDDPETLLAREFLLPSPLVKPTQELADYARPFFGERRPLLSAVRELTRAIYRDFKYDPGYTAIATPLADVIRERRGVCQDFAHLAIGCLRALGFPARYVSGYIETEPPPGREKLKGADASHAWFAVFSPGEGWFEFDPTNDKPAAEQHVVTAWGRDYADVTPLQGVIFGGGEAQKLDVAVDVERLPP